MVPEFHLMQQHNEAPRSVPESGKVVLSQLPRGISLIGAPAASLKLVLEGEENYEVDGRMYRIEPGQFLYLDAGVDCHAHIRRSTRGMCLLLPAPAAAISPAGDEPLLPRALVLPVKTSSAGRTLDAYARQIAARPDSGDQLASDLMHRVNMELNELVSDVSIAIGRLKSAKPATRRAIYQRLEAARAFLHDQTDRNVPLAELAAMSGISQFHFARYFKAAFGSAPIAYHRSLRMMKAAEILRLGDRPINEVADSVGYSDQVAFTHAFRRQFGAPPGRWAREAGHPTVAGGAKAH